MSVITLIYWVKCPVSVYVPKKLSLLINRPKHPVKVYVWAGISKKGATGVSIFKRTIDSKRYVYERAAAGIAPI